MNLTADLVDQFVDATKDEEKKSSDGIVYGTVVKDGDATYVQLDGSSTATPVSTTMNVKHGDRVTVLIKNHTATITGNYSYPADSTTSTMTSINSFNMAVGNKVTVETLTANEAFVKFLLSDKITAEAIIAAEAEINKLDVDELTVENLKAVYGEFEELDAYFADLGVVTIDKATIQDLNAVSGQFRELNVDFAKFEELVTTKATVGDLFAKNVEAEIINSTAVNAKFADIEFANIKEAAIEKIYSSIGVIQGFTAKDATVTDKLTAVEIDGDVITANTLKADRLILKDSTSGLYYQLNLNALGEAKIQKLDESKQQELQNGLHGSVIIAKSVTADKISVSDLTAFKALIAGFTLKDNEYVVDENGEYALDEDGNPQLTKVGAIYSGVKSSIDNTTRGIYLDNNGQVNFGDSNNFLKFYKDTDEEYKLAVRASEFIFGSSGKNAEDSIDTVVAFAEAMNETTSGNVENLAEQINENAVVVTSLNGRVEFIEGRLDRLVTGKDGATLMTQTDEGYKFEFYDVTNRLDSLDESMVDALEYRGRIEFEEEGGDPFIRISAVKDNSDVRLKLTSDAVQFVDKTDQPIASIVADTTGRTGMEIDNATVTGELRQSNSAATGEFVWQVRSNGNYGLSWKG